ncbi:MAG: hypothetical protein R3F30_13170 [Planctomycetota bacterium]
MRLGALALLAALAPPAALPAQNTLSRDFEADYLARREAEVDRAWRAADATRREDSLLPLHRALDLRSNDVLNGQRADLLCQALAVLRGVPYAKDEAGELVWTDAQAWRDFRFRFDFWLLGLPEAVDAAKSELDVHRIAELFRGRLPELGAVVGPEQRLGPGRVYLTARGVFGPDRPEDLGLRMGLRDLSGKVLSDGRRGDSDDPKGWRVFDLMLPFDVDDLAPGTYEGFAEVRCDGRAPGALAPDLSVRFAVRPGLHRDYWRLLERRRTLQQRPPDRRGDAFDVARLDVALRELHRVLVLGDGYCFRSWPLEALAEAEDCRPAVVPVRPGLPAVQTTPRRCADPCRVGASCGCGRRPPTP